MELIRREGDDKQVGGRLHVHQGRPRRTVACRQSCSQPIQIKGLAEARRLSRRDVVPVEQHFEIGGKGSLQSWPRLFLGRYRSQVAPACLVGGLQRGRKDDRRTLALLLEGEGALLLGKFKHQPGVRQRDGKAQGGSDEGLRLAKEGARGVRLRYPVAQRRDGSARLPIGDQGALQVATLLSTASQTINSPPVVGLGRGQPRHRLLEAGFGGGQGALSKLQPTLGQAGAGNPRPVGQRRKLSFGLLQIVQRTVGLALRRQHFAQRLEDLGVVAPHAQVGNFAEQRSQQCFSSVEVLKVEVRFGLVAPTDQGHFTYPKFHVQRLGLLPSGERQFIQPAVKSHEAEVERAIGDVVRLSEGRERFTSGEQVGDGLVKVAQLRGDQAEILYTEGRPQRQIQAHEGGVRLLLKGKGQRKLITTKSKAGLLEPCAGHLARPTKGAKACLGAGEGCGSLREVPHLEVGNAAGPGKTGLVGAVAVSADHRLHRLAYRQGVARVSKHRQRPHVAEAHPGGLKLQSVRRTSGAERRPRGQIRDLYSLQQLGEQEAMPDVQGDPRCFAGVQFGVRLLQQRDGGCRLFTHQQAPAKGKLRPRVIRVVWGRGGEAVLGDDGGPLWATVTPREDAGIGRKAVLVRTHRSRLSGGVPDERSGLIATQYHTYGLFAIIGAVFLAMVRSVLVRHCGGQSIVEATRRDLARTIWRQLAARNQWQLILDEEALLAQVLAETSVAANAESSLRAAFQRIYSARLYAGIRDREERAAYELWLMLLRLAVRGGETTVDADDLAQESVARVLAKLDQVRSPQGFLAWAMMVFRTAQRDLRAKQPVPLPQHVLDEPAQEPLDPADLVAEVEGRLLEQAFCDHLRAAIPNDLERLTLLRCIIGGDDPRDVAQDLGLPFHRTRVAKSRALQRLRANASFMTFIQTLVAPESEATPGGSNVE